MKGSFKIWLLGKIAWIVAIGAVLIMTMGLQATGSLYGTTAVVTGQSGGMFIESVPQFFKSIQDGREYVKSDAPKPKKKPSDSTDKKG